MTPDWQPEFDSLLTLHLSGQASESDVQRLDRLLAANADARQAYLRLMTLDTLMRVCAKSQFLIPTESRASADFLKPVAGSDVAPSALMGEGSAISPSPLTGEGRGEGSPTKSPVLGFLGGVIDYVSQSRTLMFWLIGGSLGLYFVAQFGSLLVSQFWARNAARVAEGRGAGTENRGRPGDHWELGPAGKVVARLTDAVDCQWIIANDDDMRGPDGQPFDIGAELHAGQKLNLVAGLAELTFDSGAKVILHSPAQFSVSDVLGGNLGRGKLTAKVPHTAAGFTIATPGGKVVDLGTEFGVKVNDSGVMNVIVYVGNVEVESNSGGAGGAGAGGADQPKVVHLHAGQAVTVGPDHIAKPIPPENERFVRDLAPLGDKSKAEGAYLEYMKSLKPVVWFRMEGKDTERVLHDEMGGQDAKLNWDGPGNPFVKGRVGKGLWLRGTKLKDYAIVDKYPLADHDKLSVSAWVYAESRPYCATIAGNWWVGSGGGGQFSFGLGTIDSSQSYDLAVLLTQASGSRVSVAEGRDHPFPLYQWSHVAFTADGATLRLYRDGREVGSTKYAGITRHSPLPMLAIGADFDKSSDPPGKAYPSWWDGKIDEFAIFNDALSPESILKLARFSPR